MSRTFGRPLEQDGISPDDAARARSLVARAAHLCLDRRSARAVYMDGDKILRQSWFPAHLVEPAHTAAHRQSVVNVRH